jgi:hypothetical protein
VFNIPIPILQSGRKHRSTNVILGFCDDHSLGAGFNERKIPGC